MLNPRAARLTIMETAIRCSAILLAMGLLPLPAQPARAEFSPLVLTLSLESSRVQYSETEVLSFVLEFRNRSDHPLRRHVKSHLDDPYAASLCLQRADGRRFRSQNDGGCGSGEEITGVLAPGESAYIVTEILSSEELDSDWMPLPFNAATGEFGVRGPVPIGEYTLWVRYWDGPALNARFSERAPAQGIYFSNVVHLSVVRDNARDIPQPRLLRGSGPGGGPLGRVFKHRGVEMVRAEALKPYGVEVQPEDHGVVLRRDSQQVSFRFCGLSGVKAAKEGPAVPAFPVPGPEGETDHIVPLQYAASGLGLAVSYDPQTKRYDLQQVAATPAGAVPAAVTR